MKRILLGAAGFFVVLLIYASLVPGKTVSPAEVTERCRASQPEWRSYDEDVKSQIGATPVAAWSADPVAVQATPSSYALTFTLRGVWLDYDAVLPVLVRDPFGQVLRSTAVTREGDHITYQFPVDNAGAVAPWLEIRYPRHERRVQLDAQGYWAETASPQA